MSFYTQAKCDPPARQWRRDKALVLYFFRGAPTQELIEYVQLMSTIEKNEADNRDDGG